MKGYYTTLVNKIEKRIDKENASIYKKYEGSLLLDVIGRAIYNCNNKQLKSKECYNDIRNDTDKKLQSRQVELKCSNAQEMILRQKTIDEILLKELYLLVNQSKLLSKNLSTSFSLSYKFDSPSVKTLHSSINKGFHVINYLRNP